MNYDRCPSCNSTNLGSYAIQSADNSGPFMWICYQCKWQELRDSRPKVPNPFEDSK